MRTVAAGTRGTGTGAAGTRAAGTAGDVGRLRPSGGAHTGPGVTGVVRGTTFRRGRTEVAVDVVGLGSVTAVAPGAWDLTPGETLALRVDASCVAVVPG